MSLVVLPLWLVTVIVSPASTLAAIGEPSSRMTWVASSLAYRASLPPRRQSGPQTSVHTVGSTALAVTTPLPLTFSGAQATPAAASTPGTSSRARTVFWGTVR